MSALFVLLRSRAAAKSTLSTEDITLYEVLGVSPGACGEEELRAGRNALARMFHPDRHPDDRRAAQFTARANAAYTVLSDAASRLAYDAALRTTHVKCSACAGAGFAQRTRGFSGGVDRRRCVPCEGWGWILKGAKK